MTTSGRGRPRSEEARTSVLASARALLLEVGYDRMSIEGIAARAGVGKQTIYRWWHSKAAVVAEATAVETFPAGVDAIPDTGDVRADLQAWLQSVVRSVNEPLGEARIRALAAAVATDPAAADALYRHVTGPGVQALVERLRTAQALHQINQDADLHGAADALSGFVLFVVLTGEHVTEDRANGLLRVVLLGLQATAQEQSTRSRCDRPRQLQFLPPVARLAGSQDALVTQSQDLGQHRLCPASSARAHEHRDDGRNALPID